MKGKATIKLLSPWSLYSIFSLIFLLFSTFHIPQVYVILIFCNEFDPEACHILLYLLIYILDNEWKLFITKRERKNLNLKCKAQTYGLQLNHVTEAPSHLQIICLEKG